MIEQEKVNKVIDELRPSLQADGGDIELVGITEDNIVHVRLKGACGSCPMSQMTLKMGVERRMQQEIPEVKGVEAV